MNWLDRGSECWFDCVQTNGNSGTEKANILNGKKKKLFKSGNWMQICDSWEFYFGRVDIQFLMRGIHTHQGNPQFHNNPIFRS